MRKLLLVFPVLFLVLSFFPHAVPRALCLEDISGSFPLTMFKRWNLVTEGQQGWDDWDVEDDWQETDDQYDYMYYPWDDAKVHLLRRFDVLNVGTIHIMSFEDDAQPEGEYIVDGVSLSHDHFGHEYDHDGFHWGSQQDLLGKEKWSETRGGMGQWVISNADIFKIPRGYMKNAADSTRPRAAGVKRELADWVSPGWFMLAEGGELAEDLSADPEDDVVWLSDPVDSVKFYHACHGSGDTLCEGVRDFTFLVILPEGFDSSSVMTLDDCYDSPPYEIMKVYYDFVGEEGGELYMGVKRAYRGDVKEYAAGSEVRPVVWTNPNNWGSVSYVMNAGTMAPPVYINEEGPFHWYDMVSRFVANHHLKSKFDIIYVPESDTVGSFYAADGIRLDAYVGEPYSLNEKRKMFFHSDGMDLDLDGMADLSHPDTLPMVTAWKEGYSTFLDSVRRHTKEIRSDSTAFIIITNGTPDTSLYRYINGKMWEDVNGWYFDQDANWFEVFETTKALSRDERILEPRVLEYWERSHVVWTIEKKMRLTLGFSLLFTDNGMFGVVGRHDSRSPVFGDTSLVEDYYDEYAVDYWGLGAWNEGFPKEVKDYHGRTVIEMDEGHLFDAVHYLGEAVDTAKVYMPHYFMQGDSLMVHDLWYREYDHGLVMMHLGVCAEVDEPVGSEDYEWIEVYMDSLEIEDDPADCGFHFMGIDGCEVNGYNNPLNDGTNVGAHPVNEVWMYLYGDGLVLLKEGDGFVELHRPRCRNAVGVEGTRLSPGGP